MRARTALLRAIPSSSPANRLEVLARAAPPGWGCFTHHPLRSSLLLNCAPRSDVAAPNLRRLLGGVRAVLVLVQVEDARRVVLVLWAEGARQLVVAVRLRLLALLLEGAAERVVGVVVVRGQLQSHPELRLGLLVALDPQVRDPECLTNRRLLRFAPLGLLECDG